MGVELESLQTDEDELRHLCQEEQRVEKKCPTARGGRRKGANVRLRKGQ